MKIEINIRSFTKYSMYKYYKGNWYLAIFKNINIFCIQFQPGIEPVSNFNGYGFGFWERFSTFSGFDIGFKIGFSNCLVLVLFQKRFFKFIRIMKGFWKFSVFVFGTGFWKFWFYYPVPNNCRPDFIIY